MSINNCGSRRKEISRKVRMMMKARGLLHCRQKQWKIMAEEEEEEEEKDVVVQVVMINRASAALV